MSALPSHLPLLLGAGDWSALLIVGVAAVWLVVRWKRKGLDDEEPGGCASCPASPSEKPEQPGAAAPKDERARDRASAVRRP